MRKYIHAALAALSLMGAGLSASAQDSPGGWFPGDYQVLEVVRLTPNPNTDPDHLSRGYSQSQPNVWALSKVSQTSCSVDVVYRRNFTNIGSLATNVQAWYSAQVSGTKHQYAYGTVGATSSVSAQYGVNDAVAAGNAYYMQDSYSNTGDKLYPVPASDATSTDLDAELYAYSLGYEGYVTANCAMKLTGN